MISFVAKKIFGTKNARVIKGMRPIVERIDELEPTMQAKSDAELRDDDGRVPAPARPRARRSTTSCPRPSRSAARPGRRVLGMRHFDVQLIGGMVLHRGSIAEMKTGEGKTLVATLPVYLNALAGKGVHVVTVNDYLARRDAEWMGRIYKFLGLSVGVIVHGLTDAERQHSYRSRHHLRHELRVRLRLPARQHEGLDRALRAARAQLRHRRRGRLDPDRRGAHAAHHLGPGRGVGRPVPARSTASSPALRKDIDYTVDEKAHSAILTDSGIERVEQRLDVGNLYDPENIAVAAPRDRRRCARTRSTSATSTTSSRTARSSSSTSSPAARCRAAAGRTACTRRSRPRKASRSRKRTRRWRPSATRTTSASTRSWPA